MKIFVTGATGVLGRPVLRRLVEAGHEVWGSARSERNVDTLDLAGAVPVRADLYDLASMTDAVAGADAVLHLATSIPQTSEMRRPGAWAENDRIRRQGTRTLVDASLAVGSVRTLIYPSVVVVYADSGAEWVDAMTGPIRPDSPTGSTIEAEAHVARFAVARDGNRGVSLRFGTFYGPESPDSRQALAMARKGFVLPLAATDAYKSLIWIDDAAGAVLSALDGAPSGVYDVTEDDPFTQAQAVRALASAVGRRRLMRLPRWLLRLAADRKVRDLLARSQRVTNARFKQVTGWAPEIPDQGEGWRRIAAS